MTRTSTPRRGGMRLVALVAVGIAGCATTAAQMDELPRAVSAYNELLRWKKLDGATRFRLPEAQADFLARYLAVEDDLHIDSLEIRAVNVLPLVDGEPLRADVTVVAHAYLLPSTILEKVLMKQRWEQREGAWLLVESDRELAPPLDDTADGALDDAGAVNNGGAENTSGAHNSPAADASPPDGDD